MSETQHIRDTSKRQKHTTSRDDKTQHRREGEPIAKAQEAIERNDDKIIRNNKLLGNSQKHAIQIQRRDEDNRQNYERRLEQDGSEANKGTSNQEESGQ